MALNFGIEMGFFILVELSIFFFFKDCGRTRTLKGPKQGPSTIMQKILLKD